MYSKFIKRFLDLFISLVIGIVALPICLIVAIIIKLESKGPVIYKQIRTGYKGKNFNAYKFRTMKVETHDKTGRELMHDERCTKFGKIIRKLSVDELPQLVNVIKGEMSLIGPRPWIPEYYENFTEEQKQRVNAMPGITGLAQTKGRNAITVFDKINYDIEYVNNITFVNDVKVFIATIATVFTRQGVEIKHEDIACEIDELKRQFDINHEENMCNEEERQNEELDVEDYSMSGAV